MARPANPELRDKILKAAAEIIEGCGPDCVTMREVAEKVGYSSTTLYLYFKDKKAILKEAVLASFDELNESCRMATVGPTALDKYRQRARAYVVWALMHPGHYSLMFQLPWETEWSITFAEESFDRLTQGRADDMLVLAEAVKAGELPKKTDLDALENSVWAALHGSVSLSIAGRLTAAIPDATLEQRFNATTAVSDDLVNALITSRKGAK